MLKFLVIVQTATKGFDTMKIKLTTEDDENESPAAMTPTKKTKEDLERKKMSLLDRAVGILKEVNEAPTAAELSEEDAFGITAVKICCAKPSSLQEPGTISPVDGLTVSTTRGGT